jgi:hypothetical protein
MLYAKCCKIEFHNLGSLVLPSDISPYNHYIPSRSLLVIDMDASYVKDMINNPDMQPNNA